MGDTIITVLDWINDLLKGIGGDDSKLILPLDAVMPSIYEYSLKIMDFVILPVAYTILALFFVLELYKASIRTDAAGAGSHLGAEMVFRVMFKMVVCKVVVDETPNILSAIYNLTTGITKSISSVVTSSGTTGGIDVVALEPSVSHLGVIEGIPVLLLTFLVFLITLIAVTLVDIIVTARFIELSVYICIAPLPLATLPNEEMSQIGKNFLKSFAAVSVQGILLFIVLSFFPVLLTDALVASPGSSGDITAAMVGVLGYSIVLVLAIFSTNRWAKAICNAM